MNDRQEYKRRAKQEKKVYFHFEIDRTHGETGEPIRIWSQYSVISKEEAAKITDFLEQMDKQRNKG